MPKLRTYQLPVFLYRGKMLLVEFARQTGKSFTLANWAVSRMLERLAKPEVQSWLIVVISNSRANGIEFGQKISDVLAEVRDVDQFLREEPESVTDDDMRAIGGDPIEVEDFFQRMELRIGNKKGRILVLAASPRTARGFSGDLILDEFAFHEHAERIWDAAEPIISANPDFVVRIASTHNGDSTLFNRWIKDGKIPRFSVRRSDAWHMGRGSQQHLQTFAEQWRKLDANACRAWQERSKGLPQPQDRIVIGSLLRVNEDGSPAEVTPEEREEEAGFERQTYRQNYENEPYHGDNLPFLSWDLITRSMTAERFQVDQQAWSDATLARLARRPSGEELYVGQDFARNGDLSVVSILSITHQGIQHIARLEMRDQTTPHQRRQMERLLGTVGRQVQRVAIDMTGNGTGLADELAERYGSLVLPIHFASTVALDDVLRGAGDKRSTMLISERMAIDLQRTMEDGRLALPLDEALRDDMRKPCRVIRGGRVLVASAKDSGDHADRFWSIALALHGHMTDGLGGWDAMDIEGADTGWTDYGMTDPAREFLARW